MKANHSSNNDGLASAEFRAELFKCLAMCEPNANGDSGLHPLFFDVISDAVCISFMPESAQHSGRGKRPCIMPPCNPVAILECVQFLQHDLGGILKKHGAPDEWQSQLNFLVTAILLPGEINSATFGRLYTEAPTIFLRVMLELQTALEKKLQSPETFVVALHLMNKRCFTISGSHLAKHISCNRRPITAKIVEHARQQLRDFRESSYP